MKEQELINEAFAPYRCSSKEQSYDDIVINKFLNIFQEMNEGTYQFDSLKRNKHNNYFESKQDREIRELAELIYTNEAIGEMIKKGVGGLVKGAGYAAGKIAKIASKVGSKFKEGYQSGKGQSPETMKVEKPSPTKQTKTVMQQKVQPMQSQEKQTPDQNNLKNSGRVKGLLLKQINKGISNPAAVTDIVTNKQFQEAVKKLTQESPMIKKIIGNKNTSLLKIAIATYLASIQKKDGGKVRVMSDIEKYG